MQRLIALVTCLLFLELGLSARQWPEPPRQHAAWHADPQIPSDIVSAAQALFDKGFPDPRGCDYRQIEVEVSSPWPPYAALAKTHGWVLPGKGTNRFAICWNGLVYPVVNIGSKVDLHTDTAHANSMPVRWHLRGERGEAATVFYTNAPSTRELLLLRSGETATALQNHAQADTMNRFGNPWDSKADPYLQFAADWAWALFDQIISAHTRGDEALALAAAHRLAALQPVIDAEAAKRGFSRRRSFPPAARKEEPFLDYLGQLPEILTACHRIASPRR